VTGNPSNIGNSAVGSASAPSLATCAAGKALLGGGYLLTVNSGTAAELHQVTVTTNRPSAAGLAGTWEAIVTRDNGPTAVGGDVTVTAFAVCSS
jgi:hypothetical protein